MHGDGDHRATTRAGRRSGKAANPAMSVYRRGLVLLKVLFILKNVSSHVISLDSPLWFWERMQSQRNNNATCVIGYLQLSLGILDQDSTSISTFCLPYALCMKQP